MLFLPLVKADQVNHLVYARAAAEEPDKAREIMDYASGRPQFEEWSGRFSAATLGKSLGNIRAMHNPRHLAGVVKSIEYDDNAKAVDVCFKVLDPVDWTKLEEGGYTGLSIGGGYLKKWKDPADPTLTRYTPRIAEISLVDSPCIPSARILELQKADGSVDEVLLKGIPRSFAEMRGPASFGELQKRRWTKAQAIGAGIGHGAGAVTGLPLMAAYAMRAKKLSPPKMLAVGIGGGLGAQLAGHEAGRAVGRVLRPHSSSVSSKEAAKLTSSASTATMIGVGVPGAGYALHRITRKLGIPSPLQPVANELDYRKRLAGWHLKRAGKVMSQAPRRGAALVARKTLAVRRRSAAVEPEVASRLRGAGAALPSRYRSLGARALVRLGRLARFAKQEAIIANLQKADLGEFAGAAGRAFRRGWKGVQAAVPHAKTVKDIASLAGGAGGTIAGIQSLRGSRKKRPGAIQEQSIVDTPQRGGDLVPTPRRPYGAMSLQEPTGDLGKVATAEQRAKIEQVLHEHKVGKLRSWRGVNPKTGKPRRGPKVTDRKQAIAIALNQARRMDKSAEGAIDELNRPMEKIIVPIVLGALGAQVGGMAGGFAGALTRHPIGAVAGGALGTGYGAYRGWKYGRALERAKALTNKEHEQRVAAANAPRRRKTTFHKSDYMALLGGLEALDKRSST